MSNYDDQIMRAWDQWEKETGKQAGNPDDFIAWAFENKKLAPTPIDITKLFRKRVTSALRKATRVDENGTVYRAKQCAISYEDGQQIPLWFDIDTGGTSNLRKKAVHQRREAIANHVYRALCDVEHMNYQHSEDIQFVLNFEDDCADRKAAAAIEDELEDIA